jgi:eukaryotic-like serine/threonine-protein kinase
MPATTTTDRLFIGDRIGNYRIELELSSTPTTTTYRAVHVVLPRRAVIKVNHGTAERPRILQMLREACILDALHHPGVIRVYDSGLHDGQPWFATELLEGHTLHGALVTVDPRARERLDVAPLVDRAEAIALVRNLAEVIEHAWSRGVVHCGLRPERILMTSRLRGYPICITDWSEARAHDAQPQPYLPDPVARPYTAPELAAGDPVDDRTDVFAIGVIAYLLLTGKHPYAQGIVGEAEPGHEPTASAGPELPPELARLVDQMLAVARWDRPAISEVCVQLASVPMASEVAGARSRRPRWTPQLSPAPDRTHTQIGIPRLADDQRE